MTEVDAKFAAIKGVHPQAALHSEGGKPIVLLPDTKFQAGGKMQQMALLLVPFSHSGYITRLFFENPLRGCGVSQNWTEHTVIGRRWWAPSWKDVSPNQPWESMLTAHLRAVA